MTSSIPFDPALTRHPLRQRLPRDVTRYTLSDPDRWRRDTRDFFVTFAVAFTGILTLFG